MNIIINETNKTSELLENEKLLEKNKKTDNCQELKNIAYKTMLLNGNDINPKYENTKNEKISNFLELESNNNKIETWTKLDKTQKIMRLNIYADTLIQKYNLNDIEVSNLKKYLIKCLERKNLTKTKEVLYNKEKNIIDNIPYLFFNEETRIFLLKKDDKHVSTFKSLPPGKNIKVKTLKIHDNIMHDNIMHDNIN